MNGNEYRIGIETVKDLRIALMSIPDDAIVCSKEKSVILHAYPDLGLVSLENEETK